MSNKDKYTNLKSTYFNDKEYNKTHFYEYSKNNSNSIDDPIFTGFTFDIDDLHSPLFYAPYETDTTLRSDGGADTDLANKIENHLNEVYKIAIAANVSTYELNTLSSKDGADELLRLIGYGKQDKFYLDNIQYGATDYIYMVDKVSTGAYSDEIGTTDIGNGSPDSSVYKTYAEALGSVSETNEDEDSEESETSFVIDRAVDENGNPIINSEDMPTTTDDDNTQVYEVDKAIAKIQEKLNSSDSDDNSLITEHQENKSKYEEAKSAYESQKQVINNIKSQLDAITNGSDGTDDQEQSLKTKLADFQTEANTELNKLKSNLSADSVITNEIDNTYENFSDFIENLASTYDKINIETNCKSKTYDADELSDTEKAKYNSDTKVKAYFDKIAEIINTYVVSCNPKTSVQSQINDLKKQLTEAEDTMYGTGESQSSATTDSIYGKYTSTKTALNNDSYSQLEQKMITLQQAKENYQDTQAYIDYQSKKTTTSKIISQPSIDVGDDGAVTDNQLDAYVKETEKIRNSRQTYEVPQTVYDMLGFVNGMKKLTREYPYVMQTVAGLDEAYKKYFSLKESYMGSGEDKITITCYESLDLRVSSMFNKYFNAVYDHQYKRERVPINMRRFQCSIFVHDIRNFRHSLSLIKDTRFTEDKDGDDVMSKIVEMALNYFSAIEFKFYDCEIVPEETGSIFDTVSNETSGEMKKTNFTFTYGNCVINFLPFADLQKYYQSNNNASTPTLSTFSTEALDEMMASAHPKISDYLTQEHTTTNTTNKYYTSDVLTNEYDGGYRSKYSQPDLSGLENVSDSNFRRWFDKSELGNVNNNDYRDYIRHSSTVEVDDAYKTSIVNNFALGSVSSKNKELSEMDEALRKMVIGISASTGIPVKGVTDALNIGNIYEYINKGDGSDMPKVTKIGNVNNSKVVDENTMEYIGNVIDENKNLETTTYIGDVIEDTNEDELDIVKDLGKISTKKGW